MMLKLFDEQINNSTNLIRKPKIENVVCTVDLKHKLKLRKIALLALNSEYNPRQLNAVIMKIKNPNTTALIFSCGKMICTGANNIKQARLSARRFARIIQKIGFQVDFSDFVIQNLVGSIDLGYGIHLEGLANGPHAKYISYEPELFPGLLYKMTEPKIVILIFLSGKVVFTGAKTFEQIYKACLNICPIIESAKLNK
jgi:transcription initiation factor TFIID TATA-box-binding protein